MKKNGFVYYFVLALLCLLVFAGCGGGSSLDGIWTGNFDGDNISLVFSGNLCFFLVDDEVEGAAEYNFDKGSGVIVIYSELITFNVKSNKLNLEIDDEKLSLTKDTTIKTPSVLSGLWKGKRGWAFAFVGDKVYILDDDEDGVIGTYKFDKNKGSIESSWYDFDFAIVGNDMITTGDEEITLTKFKK